MPDIIKFSFIAACFLTVLVSYRFCLYKMDWVLLAAGMASTLAADYFLILLNRPLPGVPVFCLAHIAYIIRARMHYSVKVSPAGPPKRNGFFFAAPLLCTVPAFWRLDLLTAFSILYAVLFVLDIMSNTALLKKSAARLPRLNRAFIFTGLVLFALCDINVLLLNLPRYFASFPPSIARAAYPLIWFFYLPAQGLLAVSAFKFTKNV